MTVYTVANQRIYDYELERGVVNKMGATENYAGGMVFQTPEDAYRHIAFSKTMAIYEVDAEWGMDTYASDEGSWHLLLNTSRIVRRVDLPYQSVRE